MIYKAICACYGGPEEEAEYGCKTEKHHTLTFEAESRVDAVRSALRWWGRMRKNFPDVYFELWSIKVHREFFGPVDAEGMCRVSTGGYFFEWKHDWMDSLEEKIQDLEKKEERRSA